MSTRGAFGVKVNGVVKVTYNHNDSYPEGLGRRIVDAVRKLGTDRIKELSTALRMVDEDVPPTEQDQIALEPWVDLSVGNQSLDDWYCLTRKLQGDLESILLSGVMVDGASFLRNETFCEWAYIVDLDSGQLVVYRYGSNPVAVYPLDKLPDVPGQKEDCGDEPDEDVAAEATTPAVTERAFEIGDRPPQTTTLASSARRSNSGEEWGH